MNVLVHSKSLEVTQAMREFAQKQATRLAKLSARIQKVSVFLESIKTSRGVNQEAKVKLRVHIPGKDIMVSAKQHDAYRAIHQAVEDAVRSLRKRKERLMRRNRIQRLAF